MSIYDKASLVLIPSGTKTSKVYSQKPVNGDGDFTFSRSTAATRVNADGNIEKETQNLLLQSNNFDTTWVNNLGGAVTGGQAGYDGTNNAWEINKNTTSFRRIEQGGLSLSGIWTLSVYAKKGTLDVISLRNFVGGDRAEFNLTSGTIINQGGGAIIARSMTDVGGGWYRCSITCNSTSTQVQIYIDWNETIGGNIYIQDAQLEQGLVARDYIETTTAAVEGGITDNVPRLDYTDSSCPALLLEPQRTNTLSQSEYFGGTHWTLGGIATIDTNSVNSPEGIQNATKLKASSSASTHSQIENNGGGSKSFTIFAKAGEENQIMIYGSTAGIAEGIVFDLSDGSFVKYWNNNSDHIDSYSSTDYGNGWYRYNINFDAITNIRLFIAKNDAITFSQTSGNGIYIYGAQFEDASYATSYIPTYGTSVTRGADVTDRGANLSYTGDYTLFMEFELTKDAVYFLTNTSLAYRLFLEADDAYFKFGSSNVFFQGMFDWRAALGTNIKMLIYKNGTDAAMFVNGTKYTPSANTLTTGNEVLDWRYINYTTTADRQEQAYIKQLIEFQEALTDADCITLTT